MLPGFRFLFAAIVLSMSILIFGLGAAALLRAAHEEFAANPSWRAAPEPVFARQSEAAKATIAMLRVEPQLPGPKPVVTATAFAPTEPTRSASSEAEKASPTPDASPVTDAAAKQDIKQDIKPDIRPDASTDAAPAQTAASLETASPPAETPTTKIASSEPASVASSEVLPGSSSETAPASTPTEAAALAKNDPATAVTEAAPATAAAPASPPPQAADSAQISKEQVAKDQGSKKLASVGDAAAKKDEPDETKAADAKAEQRARLRAERAKERKRLAAQRARLQQQAAVTPQFDLQQQVTNPFAPPSTTRPPARTKHAARTPAAPTQAAPTP